ncbi:MAG: Mur ligase family protein [Candidatus Omnitrophota bacterium]
MNIEDFRIICVMGWGISGVSLCGLLLSLKKKVKISEVRERNCFESSLIDEFTKRGVEFEFGGHSRDFIKDSRLVVLSPGVDTFNSLVSKYVKEFEILCVGEIELCSWLTKAKIIALTGTNGKTTTSYLTHRVLQESKERVFLGGNIGTPFSSFVLNTNENSLVVLELSSFQLETIFEFRPYAAALLNIEPDHLDRYADLKDYLKAKMNIFKNQQVCDWALLNKNIAFRADIEKSIKSQIVYFSQEFSNENLSCIARIAAIFGLNKDVCLKVFSEFKGLPHRLQVISKLKGVTFINDSKATNPSSTIWALKNIKAPVILIAGGKDKGLDYSCLSPYSGCLKKINLIGQAAFKIKEALGSNMEAGLEIFSSLEGAVKASFEEACQGDTVLLSPMCASFDMFTDYKQRGCRFMEIVNTLK